MTQAERFVEAARASMGTRWMHQGRLPGVGLDCAGLAICAAAAIGMEFKDVEGYSRAPTGHSLVRAIEQSADRVRGEPQLGDILALSTAEIPTHMAIFCGGGRIIHTWAAVQKVVEHEFNSSWQECLRGVFRPRWSE